MAFQLLTARMRLREFTTDDAELFFRLRSDPQIMRYTHEPSLPDVAAARAALEAYPDYVEHGFGRWACELEGRVIGFCGLKYLDDREVVDVGYRFVPEQWGKGLASEAAGACVRYGLDELKLPRIIAMVLPENPASGRVAEKAGLVRVGTTVEDGLEALLFAVDRVHAPPG